MKKHLSIMATLVACIISIVQGQTSWKLPKYEKYVLKNGLTVYLMEHHEVPLLSAHWVSPAGSIHDGQKNGLANLAAQGMGFGTKSFKKEQIDALTDSVGASLNFYADVERAGFSSQFAAKDQDLLWKIMAELIISPTFPEETFQKEKTRMTQELAYAKESPRSVMDAYWRNFMYSGHPYANHSSGTEPGMKLIAREDLVAFHEKHVTAAGSALIVVGDFQMAAMKERIARHFGVWKSPKPTNSPLSAPSIAPKRPQVLLVNKSDSRETRFMIGGAGVPRNHPDFAAIQVVNTILGGRFTSWLNSALRINSGLSYGARSSFSSDKLAGTFSMMSFTATENTEKAIDLALKVLDSLHTYGPDEATLSSAKNYVLGGFAPDYETSDQLAGLLADFHTFGMNEQFINTFAEQVENVDVARVKTIISKYFPRNNLQFLVIGKGDLIRDGLRKYGVLTEKEITASGY